MNVDKITKASDYAMSLWKTKDGRYMLFVILLIGCGYLIYRNEHRHLSMAIEERKDALVEVRVSMEREARIKDECAENMRKYFDMFKELGSQFSGEVSFMQSVKTQTDAVVRQQQSIINNSTNDETY